VNQNFANFELNFAGEFRRVQIVFGDETDVRGITRWRASPDAPLAVRDALEFARLASKRWRYYKRTIPTIRSLRHFHETIESSPRVEASFILVARAAWFSSKIPLGLAQCRRTFCNNIILEFLAVHPRVLERKVEIRGVGTGLVHALASLAVILKTALVWGEATEYSSTFYKKTFDFPEIKDHFFIGAADLKRCSEKFVAESNGRVELD